MSSLKSVKRFSRTFTWGWVVGIAMAIPTSAIAITWNLNCGTGCSGLDGTDGNQRMFTAAGGAILTAQGFSSANANGTGNFVNSFLGWYPGGLGVTSPGATSVGGDGNGSNDRHTVDNSGKKDIVVFRFPTTTYIPFSVVLSAFGDTDIDAWVGGNGKSFSDFLGLSFNSFTSANGFTACTGENSGSSNNRTADIDCNVAGQFLIIAADKDGTNDEFKIKGLNADSATVPEPSSWFLALCGLIGLRRFFGFRH